MADNRQDRGTGPAGDKDADQQGGPAAPSGVPGNGPDYYGSAGYGPGDYAPAAYGVDDYGPGGYGFDDYGPAAYGVEDYGPVAYPPADQGPGGGASGGYGPPPASFGIADYQPADTGTARGRRDAGGGQPGGPPAAPGPAGRGPDAPPAGPRPQPGPGQPGAIGQDNGYGPPGPGRGAHEVPGRSGHLDPLPPQRSPSGTPPVPGERGQGQLGVRGRAADPSGRRAAGDPGPRPGAGPGMTTGRPGLLASQQPADLAGQPPGRGAQPDPAARPGQPGPPGPGPGQFADGPGSHARPVSAASPGVAPPGVTPGGYGSRAGGPAAARYDPAATPPAPARPAAPGAEPTGAAGRGTVGPGPAPPGAGPARPAASPPGRDNGRPAHGGLGTDVPEQLTPELLLPGRRRAPAPGWRRIVYQASGGLLRVPLSSSELGRQDMISRARAPVVGGHHRVAVMSLKGGVGKTTTTVGLGSTLASLRGDRVIAVDANPDRGTLSDKVHLETAATVRDLVNERAQIRRYADVRTFTSQAPSRLEILASDRDPTVSVAFSESDYRSVCAVLEHYYSICLTDCGTGLMHSAMAGVLRLADQMVLVSTPSVDGARSASATLDWLEAHGYGDLVREAVVVLCAVRPRSRGAVDLQRLEEYFAARCRAVTRIPYDPHLEEGAEVELDLLGRPTSDAYLALAALVGDGLARPRNRALHVPGPGRPPG